MVEPPNQGEKSERAQLMEIANYWTNHGEYPKGISETDIQELSQALHKQLDDLITTYVNNTNFTRSEAEVRALTRPLGQHYHLLTIEAVALILSTPGTGFDDTTDAANEATEGQPITTEDVMQRRAAGKKKVKDAKRTYGAATFPDRNDVLTSPDLVWLDDHTVQRLRNQYQPDENTLDDVVARLLNETETHRSLEAFVVGYLNARGKDNVAQVAVQPRGFQTETLRITAHTSVQEELPDIVTETDAITHHSHRYDLHFHEDPSRPTNRGHITLYASDTIDGMDEVTLDDGLAAADEHMQQLLDSDEPLPSRTIE